MTIKKKEKKLLVSCLIFSIALHIVAIISLHNNSIKSSFSNRHLLFTNHTNLTNLSKKNTQEVLKLIFHKPKTVLTESKKTFPQLEEESEIQYALSQIREVVHQNNIKIDFQIDDKNLPNEIIKTIDLSKNKTIALNKKKSENLISEIKEKSKVETKQFLVKNNNDAKPQNEETTNLFQPVLKTNEKEYKTNHASIFAESLNLEMLNENLINIVREAKYHKKVNVFSSLPPLLEMPSLTDLMTSSHKDDFNLDVTFAPRDDDAGYIFAITLIPKPNTSFKRLKQNFFFLLDKSNSIQDHRLTSSRHAIASSLSLINKDDTFNILAYDNKLELLSTTNLHPNNLSVSKAKSFLLDQKLGSFFSSTNLSNPFFKILDNNTSDDEINIAVLLSNGEDINKSKNYKIINEWSYYNKGNLCLYSIALSDDKNLSLLDFFSSRNKGKLVASTTPRGLKRKLQKLIKNMDFPIAKNIVSTAVCNDLNTNIVIYPPAHQLPNLYLNEPYVILGTINKLEDFTIFIQGKRADKWFNIKKDICFDNAKQETRSLQEQLAIKRSSLCYEKFLADGNPIHLQEATKILEPFDIPAAFR